MVVHRAAGSGASMPKTAPSAPKSTATSKVTGMKAGQVKNGLPLITSG